MTGFGTAGVAGSCLAAWYYLAGVSAEMVSPLRGTATLGIALLIIAYRLTRKVRLFNCLTWFQSR